MPLSDTAIGYLAAAGAILCFGSFGVFIKAPAVRKANVDPVVFQCYYSLAVFLTTWVLLIFDSFAFTWHGVGGAALWVPASLLAIVAINLAGMAIAQGVWSGSTIIVSFMWGAFFFGEEIESWPLTVMALEFLMIGIAGISLSNMQFEVPLDGKWEILYRVVPCFKPPAFPEWEGVQEKFEEEGEEETAHVSSPLQVVLGIGAAALLGMTNGSMMVPAERTDSQYQGVPYAISFAIGVAMVTLVIVPIYCALHWARGKGIPQFHVRVAFIPGFLAGTVWNAGNIFSIYATQYLGMTIGFPLTQMALLVGGLWGMLLFREITRVGAILAFFASALVLLGGAALLSFYG